MLNIQGSLSLKVVFVSCPVANSDAPHSYVGAGSNPAGGVQRRRKCSKVEGQELFLAHFIHATS